MADRFNRAEILGKRLFWLIEIDFGGVLIDRKQSNVYRLRDTTRWYPHVGKIDRATYDVTFHHPRHFDLVAGGRRVGAGRDSAEGRWERRVLDMPASAFSFEIGHFDQRRVIVGHVDVVVAFDRASRRSSRNSASTRSKEASGNGPLPCVGDSRPTAEGSLRHW